MKISDVVNKIVEDADSYYVGDLLGESVISCDDVRELLQAYGEAEFKRGFDTAKETYDHGGEPV